MQVETPARHTEEKVVDTGRGMTPAEVARYLRLSPDTVRSLIRSGQLAAVNTSPTRTGKPRWVVLPAMLDAWIRSHQATTETPQPRRKRRPVARDYYPD